MKKVPLAFLAWLVLLPASGYELATHSGITWRAYQKSKLFSDASLRRDLGMDWYLVDTTGDPQKYNEAFGTTDPFGEAYFDRQGAALSVRAATQFENDIIGLSEIPPLTVPGWLMRGSVREDDSSARVFAAKDEPLDDPYGNINRWCNHFFDPTPAAAGARQATFWCPYEAVRDAANWAAGTNDLFGSPADLASDRRNHFTIADAREAQYRAITGRSTDGSNAGAQQLEANFSERKTYYATMFRALGDVLHLNQDMAQPQHTRNEPHAGFSYGDPTYEKYIDARVRGWPRFDYGTSTKPTLQSISFGANPAEHLSSYADYWMKADGTGLAQYSNANFFTVLNNFGSSNYRLPPPNDISAFDLEQASSPQDGAVTYLRYKTNGIRVSRQNGFSEFLPTGHPKTYTLDFEVYDAMASALLPKAVANSAGLLDHFFRGKLQIQLPAEGIYSIVDHAQTTVKDGELTTNNTGFNKIKLKLSAPQTGYDDQTQQFGSGVVLAVLKFRRNICASNNPDASYDFSGTQGKDLQHQCRTTEEEVVVSNPANNGSPITPTTTPQSLTFDFPKALPINATDVRLQVVFRGSLGTEANAVVIATQDIAEPTFFSYINSSDYYTIQGEDPQNPTSMRVYTRDAINASADLLRLVYPQSCVDTSVTPNQLKANCLNPVIANVGYTVGNGVTVRASALPLQRFIRFAVLGNADAATSMGALPTNNCLPQDGFAVNAVAWQSNPVLANNKGITAYPTIRAVRGVYDGGGVTTGCVGLASSRYPSVTDNPNFVWTSLPATNLAPWPVQIDGF